MKITVITGSPHEGGTSVLLAEEFIRGAREQGHEIFRFNAAEAHVAPCVGCDKCGCGQAPCAQNDDMDILNPRLLEADAIVFVTPLYYFGFSAQMKAVIDRFHANINRLAGHKKAVLLVTSFDDKDWTMNAVSEQYKSLARYLQWKNAGMVLATGCGSRKEIEHSSYPKQAYLLGRSI